MLERQTEKGKVGRKEGLLLHVGGPELLRNATRLQADGVPLGEQRAEYRGVAAARVEQQQDLAK
eukprot:CAMPEP_0179912104 /NCGR_PEP_ID=MMETSP0982-20121206/46729_1 /TAXON_ID=483367 /ORGANISM="non described non described, Strain CCMP 2436" /LENGTH=63 /DNA_ID=CAMNT_0021813915 /DNA_START=319 /DNA_END=510 /DNA_ORIENTATION=-